MPENTGDPGSTETPPAGQTPAGDPPKADPPPSGSQSGASEGGKTFSEEYVTKLRQEAADRRKHEQELEAKLDEYEKGQLGDKERMERERDEARKTAEEAEAKAATAREELRDEKVYNAFVTEAQKLEQPLHSLDDAFTFIQKDYASDIKVEDDGQTIKVAGVDTALKKLTDDRKYLLASPTLPSGQKVAGRTDGGAGVDEARKAELQRKFPAQAPR